MMKPLGIALLSIASLGVFASMVLPVMGSLVLGLGIEIPSFWARIGDPHFILLYPWASLLFGVSLPLLWDGAFGNSREADFGALQCGERN